MAMLDILHHPDSRLRKKAAQVNNVDASIRRLVDDMFETMYEAPGIGLAAVQVGEPLRLLVADVSGKDEEKRPLIIVNPEIVARSDETSVYEEGCLSIPDQYAEVDRPAEVRVRWTALDGTTQEEQFAGLWATCVQHEIDHLNGKLFIDFLGPLKRQMITRKMEKLKRERARQA